MKEIYSTSHYDNMNYHSVSKFSLRLYSLEARTTELAYLFCWL